MIQRVQTLWLLAATALMVAVALLPSAWFVAGTVELKLFAFGLKDTEGVTAHSTIYLAIPVVLATLLPFVTVFLYRNRMLQIRLCVVELVLLAGCEAMLGIYYFLSCRVLAGYEFHAQGMYATIALPLVAMLCAYLAARAIFRDELLIRSTDRIR